jgi:hypothetical protein
MYHLRLYFKNVTEPLTVTITEGEKNFNLFKLSISEAMANKEILTISNTDDNVTHVIDGADLRAMI